MLRALVLLLAFPALVPLVPALKADPPAPDFSAVTSRAAARRLVREGRLVEIRLFPVELGGPDERENVGYVTLEAATAQAMIIGTLGRYVEEDVVDRLEVVPEYEGDSIVPRRILMTATHSARPGAINMTIPVW